MRAALSLIGAVASVRNVAAALQLRVGIATGTVVVTELLIEKTPAEQAVVGATPNLAARLQTMAEPGTVLISASTRRITGGEFHYRDLGPVTLKGWAEPLPVYEVLGMSGVESRFEATHTTKLPPLFGREEEIELLSRRWRQATREEGRLVTLTGEPGIGKSHIALALNERLQGKSHVTLRYFCSEHHTHSALFPFINQLERAAGFKHSNSPQEKLSKLDALLAQSTHDPEHLAVLANLLMLPADDPTGCTTSLHKNAKRRPSRHYRPSSIGWPRNSRFCSFSKMCIGLTRPRLNSSRQLWSARRSFGHWC